MRATTLILLFFLVAGCSKLPNSYFNNRNRSYLSARSIPPLSLPPGLSSDSFTDEFPISHQRFANTNKDVSLKPPGLQ